jgi:hypothetical protein
MEPVSALALACNILDLIERGYKCAATIKEVHESETGLLKKHEVLVGEISTLSDIAGAFNKTQQEISKSLVDARMRDIAKKCLSICAAIQTLVDQCKPEKEGSFRSAAQASIRILLRKSDIDTLQSELGSAQKMMDSLVMTKTLYVATPTSTVNSQVSNELESRRDVARLGEQLGDVRQKIEKHARQSSSQLLLISEKLRVLSSSLDGAAQSGPVVEQLREVLGAATEATEAIKIIQILDDLHFPTMKERFSNVNGPARNTFDWVFEDSKTFLHNQPGSKIAFRDWLRSGSGIFHVEGKPGSGKSTLMKHICEHCETRQILREWAGEKKLITSQFFFWRPGTPEQKSLRGLIRGLLWGIIRQEPQLAKLLFPRLWRPTELPAFGRSQFIDLSVEDVDEALGLLLKGGDVLDEYHFCFFIDGLDEFDENRGYTQYQLTQHLLQWASSPCRNVKLCVSSRQLPVFANAFSPAQRLTIHIFTDEDIEQLVKQRLEGNGAFQKLAQSEKDRCDKMVRQVIESAEGVFLWVCVLLNLLEDSLGNGDSIAMLESIINSTPTELDDFFSHILNSIPLHYRRQAFIILALAMRLDGFLLSEETRDFNGGAWKGDYENDGWNLSLLSCSYLLEGLDNGENLEKLVRKVPKSLPSNIADYRIRIERGSVGVAGRCKGLLEKQEGSIEFIHRSVPEFLQKFLAKTFPTPELNDEIVSSALAWMMLIDLGYRENRKPEGNAEQDPGSSSDSDSEDDLFAPTVLIDQDLGDGDAINCIKQLLFQIRQAPGTNYGPIMPLLQQIEQELLHHQFGIRTFNEVPEDKRPYYDIRSSADPTMFSLFFMAAAVGFIEIILWDHENESLSLTRGQDWVIANLLRTVTSMLPHYRCKARNNRFFGLSHTTMLKYFFQAGVSVATEVEVDHRYPPWTEYPAPELRSEHEVQLESPEQSRRGLDDSSSAEAGSHRAALQDLLVIALLTKPRHKPSEKQTHLCLDPFPPIFGETLGVLLRYGANLSITMSLSDLSWLEDDGTERSKSDPDRDIELLPANSKDKNHDDNDDEEGDDNIYFMTGRSKYQLLRRIHLIRDEDGSEIITVCGVIGSSPGLVRGFWELLISSGGSITLRDFLRFIKAQSLDTPLPPVGDNQPDGGLLMTHSSSSSEESVEQAEASDNEDFGDQATKEPGLLSWAILGKWRNTPPEVGVINSS